MTLPTLLARWRARLRPDRPRAIGLELADERVNLVQFSGPGPTLRAVASEPYPLPRDVLLARPGALRDWLRPLMAAKGFQGRQVVTCLPAGELRLFPLSVTLAEGGSHEQALSQALRSRLGDELSRSVVDYLPIRHEEGEGQQRDALVAVAPREQVMAHLQRLSDAGLDPVALEVGPAALARLISFVNAADARDRFPHVVVINFGRQRSHVSVVWGRRLVLDREIDVAEDTLVERVARVLEMDKTTARRLLLDKGLEGDDDFARTLVEVLRPELALLVSEINRTLIYTASRSRGRGIDQLYLLGSVGRYPGIDTLLQQQLAVPVQVLNPFRAFRSPLDGGELERLKPIAGIAVAAGLALRGLIAHA